MIPDLAPSLTELERYASGETELGVFLDSLPDDSGPEFQLVLTKLVEQLGHPVGAALVRAVQDNSLDRKARYGAFAALATYYRRYRHVSRSAQLFEQYRAEFYSFDSFDLLEALHLMAVGSPEAIRESYRLSEAVVRRLDKHTGAYAAHADIVATAWDAGIISDPAALENTAALMRTAMRLQPAYAKYPFLLGKLLMRMEQYEEAGKLILRAIDIEDSARPTYAIRIGEYQLEHLRLSLLRAERRIATAVKAQEVKLVEFQNGLDLATSASRSESILLLGLFSGILGVAVTSVQISTRLDPVTGALLVVVLAGALICAYSCLAYTVVRESQIKRCVVTAALGFVLMVTGIVGMGLPSVSRDVPGDAAAKRDSI